MLNEIRDAIHANSIAKGFWEEPNTNITEKIMLVVTELSEAVEAMRKLSKEELISEIQGNSARIEAFYLYGSNNYVLENFSWPRIISKFRSEIFT